MIRFEKWITSKELTYLTKRKGKSSTQKCRLGKGYVSYQEDSPNYQIAGDIQNGDTQNDHIEDIAKLD